ncbi:Endonuclease/exonuclease/phosphatase [Ignavibacterium album JCM 16511]|uniref:Endonuclease/exonuclease/phosphatase n=1 Tax=Ignavibacterium album (strain DSM 19864 / JCM 16511 / NBRC 101810 / Mat9-16) TaxID=945713 RepID=I0AJT4_IGNAJ|nr:endonuclease/exonuclease/phosphatase [Ignavibacterium album]AFH49241.1 Endonuclease/exonuclease/phosphatase [Ignavibacterium album JCM 16511]
MKKMLFIFLISLSSFTCAQNNNDKFISVAFWNLENLFDAKDDTQKNDEEFLPDGLKQWNDERLDRKFYNLARVIRSMNDGNGPDIFGVCEVEHKYLLDSLISKHLFDKNYISESPESPDERGIQTGIIFRADKFKLLETYTDAVKLEGNIKTRLILGVKLLYKNSETFYVFVNHWPSRRGGESESEIRRIKAAQTLRKRIEQVFNNDKYAKIIIMGDFNDEPINNSILSHLKAKPIICDSAEMIEKINSRVDNSDLFNLAYHSYSLGEGSYKHQDNWNMLDQIIVSRELIIGKKVRYQCNSFQVYKPEFMITKTGKYQGTPFPTYGGNRYLGGYSDHFPVIAKIILE